MKGEYKAIKFDKKLFLLVALLLTVITIPLNNHWNSWAIFYFIFAGLIQLPLKESIQKLWKSRYWVLSVAFFFWQAATWFWDSPGAPFFKNIEIYGAFLSMPIIFTIIPRLTGRDIALICYAFVATIVVVCIVCLLKATIEYQHTHDPFQFSYHYLSYTVKLNAIFLSNYCLSSIIWLLYYNVINKNDNPCKLPLVVLVIICLFLVGMIFLLSSKLVIFLTVVTAVYFITRISGIKNIFRSIVIAAAVMLATFLVIYNVTYLKFRIFSTSLKKYSGSADDQNGLAARLLMWQSATELIAEQPVIGYGTQHSKEAILKKYQDKGFELGIKERYNAHNQFLQTFLGAGIIGLLLFLAVLFFPVRTALKEKRLLLIAIVSHYIIQSQVESTLTVQQELIFFWFFIWLFYFQWPSAQLPGAITSEKPRPGV